MQGLMCSGEIPVSLICEQDFISESYIGSPYVIGRGGDTIVSIPASSQTVYKIDHKSVMQIIRRSVINEIFSSLWEEDFSSSAIESGYLVVLQGAI